MKKYWILIIGILLVAATAIIVWITGPVRLNWNVTAYLITADGTEKSSFPITIQGKIQDSKNSENMADLFLDIDLPKDFRYSFGSSNEDALPAWNGTEFKGGNPDDLRAITYTYDAIGNEPSACTFVINAELGYFFACWPNDSSSYLVASTDPGITAQELISYFDVYIQSIIVPNWPTEAA